MSESLSPTTIEDNIKKDPKLRSFINIKFYPIIMLVTITLMFVSYSRSIGGFMFVEMSSFGLALHLFYLGIPLFMESFYKTITSTKIKFLAFTLMLFFYFLCLSSLFWPLDIFIAPIILVTAIAAGLGVVISIILLRRKEPVRQRLAIRLGLFLTMLLIMLSPGFLRKAFSHIYTPPALTSKNIAAYTEYINFVNNDKYKKRVSNKSTEELNRYILYMLSGFPTESPEEKLMKVHVYEKITKTRCLRIRGSKNMLLFYKNANYLLPRPGVLYSLDGQNPNEIDSELLNSAKPFTKIYGNWYTSKKLVLRGPRTDVHTSIPKALIDNSLKIKGLTPKDLTIEN